MIMFLLKPSSCMYDTNSAKIVVAFSRFIDIEPLYKFYFPPTESGSDRAQITLSAILKKGVPYLLK